MRVAERIRFPQRYDGELRLSNQQPPGIGPISGAVVGHLQDRNVSEQVRDVGFPPGPLWLLGIAGEEDRESPVIQPDADRIVVLFLRVLWRLGEHRERDGS